MSEHVKSNGPERLESDEFVEYETTKTTKRTGVKRKCVYSNNVANEKRCKKNGGDTIEEKPKTLLCSPDAVELIPMSHIFRESIGCLLCPYNTKVRSNLISHLHAHRTGQVYTTKEIVNPVLTKSKRVVDKTIDLSASSLEAMNTEKTKIIEMNNGIVEVAFQGKINAGSYPTFIQKSKRFKCSMSFCTYTSEYEDMLKTHITTYHPYSQSYMRTALNDDSVDGNGLKARSVAAHWICNVCGSGVKYKETEIKSHIFMAHGISGLFKCPMCPFERDDDDPVVFKEHYKLDHPSVAVKILRVFEKVTDAEIKERRNQAKRLSGAANTREKQALRSIEPSRTCRPTCRGIPVSTTAASRAYQTPCGVSESVGGSSAMKRKTLTDGFSVDDSFGTITVTGLFSCPRCNDFTTRNIDHFRDHLLKDVKCKIWKCMKCSEITDSPNKMAWHVKKHQNGSKYETIESAEKLHWVKEVIAHQKTLIEELQKTKHKHLFSV